MQEQQKENGPKLSETTRWLMLGTAIFFDVFQWLLAFILMDWLVGIIAPLTFWLWFKLAGQKMSLKHVWSLSGGTLIEIIPIIGALIPTWTAVILYLTRVEKIVNTAVSSVPGGKVISETVNKVDKAA